LYISGDYLCGSGFRRSVQYDSKTDLVTLKEALSANANANKISSASSSASTTSGSEKGRSESNGDKGGPLIGNSRHNSNAEDPPSIALTASQELPDSPKEKEREWNKEEKKSVWKSRSPTQQTTPLSSSGGHSTGSGSGLSSSGSSGGSLSSSGNYEADSGASETPTPNLKKCSTNEEIQHLLDLRSSQRGALAAVGLGEETEEGGGGGWSSALRRKISRVAQDFLVDPAELSIDLSSPLGVGSTGPVYFAKWRSLPVRPPLPPPFFLILIFFFLIFKHFFCIVRWLSNRLGLMCCVWTRWMSLCCSWIFFFECSTAVSYW
jgi:hypothetical protein